MSLINNYASTKKDKIMVKNDIKNWAYISLR